MAAMRALEELGRISELRARLPQLLDEAAALDDRYAQVTFRLYQSFWQIAAGDVGAARAAARDGLARWDQPAQHLQHLYARRIDAFCDVSQDRSERAWRTVVDSWPAIRRANLLRHPILRTDAYLFRACIALAHAMAVGNDPALLRDAERCAKKLEGARRSDASAAAALVRAGVASLRGDTATAGRLLAVSESRYEEAEMPLHASYARRRAAQLVGGETRGHRIEQIDVELRERGISRPSRWLGLVAPGFPAAS